MSEPAQPTALPGHAPSSEPQRSRAMPYLNLLLAVLLFLVPQLIAGIGFAIYVAVSGSSLEELTDQNSVGANFGIYAVAELLTLGAFLLVVMIKQEKLSNYGVTFKGIGKIWMVIPAFFMYFAATIIVQLIAGFFISEETLQAEQQLGFEGAAAVWELVLAFVALVVIAPFVEELLFRGFLFNELRKDWSFIVTALVTALLFGLAHMQLNVGLDTFVLALPLAYLIEKTRTLSAPILLHAAKNMVAFTILFIVDADSIEAAITRLF